MFLFLVIRGSYILQDYVARTLFQLNGKTKLFGEELFGPSF